MSTLLSGLSKTEAGEADPLREFAADVQAGLTRIGQKELHSRYFYDELGSALFEAITVLPEYGLSRADLRILTLNADQIAARVGTTVLVAELGSGTGQKTRCLLQALRRRQLRLRYCPIDVSQAALEKCARDTENLADVHPLPGTYLPGVRKAVGLLRPEERLLLLFLGSTIGNFERGPAMAFLQDLRSEMRDGDFLLLGADLVKPQQQLLPAYDDPAGVTAAFNLNLLARINRELGANFNLRQFRHQAIYNAVDQRVEMHIVSLVEQTVDIPLSECRVDFQAGETIWTESSHKYYLSDLDQMAADSGFRVDARWLDNEWPFVETLWIAN